MAEIGRKSNVASIRRRRESVSAAVASGDERRLLVALQARLAAAIVRLRLTRTSAAVPATGRDRHGVA